MSSYLQHAWDGRLKEIPNLRLIITCSPMSTVIREVLAYSAPLYFRCNTAYTSSRCATRPFWICFPRRRRGNGWPSTPSQAA
jgi:hypothetical protein